MENSPLFRRQRLVYSLLVPGLLCLVGLVALRLGWNADPVEFAIGATVAVVVGVPASIGWFCFGRWYWMVFVLRSVRKVYSEGSNRTMLGWREMELAGDRLKLKTEFLESSIDLRAIDKIVGNENYTFVYISSNQAYLIPMNLYPEEEYRQFVSELCQAWEDRDEMPPIPSTQPRDDRIVEQPR
jgi:hypothetical protein